MEEKANRMINEADAMEAINNELAGEDLEAEFKTALKAKNELKLSVVRMVKSAIMNAEISSGGKGSFDDAQIIEIIHCLEEIKSLFERYARQRARRGFESRLKVPFKPNPGKGIGIMEAPRGLLYHEYELDKEGNILHCNIITPTAMFLARNSARSREKPSATSVSGKRSANAFAVGKRFFVIHEQGIVTEEHFEHLRNWITDYKPQGIGMRAKVLRKKDLYARENPLSVLLEVFDAETLVIQRTVIAQT